jgi:hypothetical protein
MIRFSLRAPDTRPQVRSRRIPMSQEVSYSDSSVSAWRRRWLKRESHSGNAGVSRGVPGFINGGETLASFHLAKFSFWFHATLTSTTICIVSKGRDAHSVGTCGTSLVSVVIWWIALPKAGASSGPGNPISTSLTVD